VLPERYTNTAEIADTLTTDSSPSATLVVVGAAVSTFGLNVALAKFAVLEACRGTAISTMPAEGSLVPDVVNETRGPRFVVLSDMI
jgi:hypothetical protein